MLLRVSEKIVDLKTYFFFFFFSQTFFSPPPRCAVARSRATGMLNRWPIRVTIIISARIFVFLVYFVFFFGFFCLGLPTTTIYKGGFAVSKLHPSVEKRKMLKCEWKFFAFEDKFFKKIKFKRKKKKKLVFRPAPIRLAAKGGSWFWAKR